VNEEERRIIQLDPGGFNELRMCRSGPMLYNKHDIYIGGALKTYAEFSVGEQDVFRRFLSPGNIAVEVGANLGAHTVDISKLVGANGEVHAFEPQRIVFQTLCANLALNQCTNVYARQAALGAQPGTILVPAMDPAVRFNFGGVTLVDADHGEPVPLMCLDSLDLPMCNFIKVDVEGMEVEVLKGALKTIDDYRPTMYLENDRDERSQELLSLVLSLEYDIYWHLPRVFNPDNLCGVKEDIFKGVVSINVLCIPKEVELKVQGLRKVVSADETWRERAAVE